MKTDRDFTYTYEDEGINPQRTAAQEAQDFVPGRPDPSAWRVKPQFVLPAKDQVLLLLVTVVLAVLAVIGIVTFAVTADVWTAPVSSTQQGNDSELGTQHGGEQGTQAPAPVNPPSVSVGAFADGAKGNVLYGTSDDFKTTVKDDFYGTNAAIANVGSGELIAGMGEDTKIYPASMTTVMTLVVAVEYLRDEAALQQKITISQAVFDAMYKEGASGMGLAVGESLTVEALLYALMLQSDGIAATELAKAIAGSEAAFVALMNQKASEMGLTNTHFMNPTGLHHEDHYSSCRDIATLMGYAMNMSLCRKILTEDVFVAPCDSPNVGNFNYDIYNNLLVTYFNKYKTLNPSKAGSLTILAGKTGYTPEAGNCLVTCAQGADGSYYVCVTAGAESYENCIKSYQSLYAKYVG